jgi:tetratricopeptide (TPR) repeat protein
MQEISRWLDLAAVKVKPVVKYVLLVFLAALLVSCAVATESPPAEVAPEVVQAPATESAPTAKPTAESESETEPVAVQPEEVVTEVPESVYTDFYTGRNQVGLAAVEDILKTEPDNAEALALRGAFNFRLSESQEDGERTLADATRAIELDPELAWGYMVRAWYYEYVNADSVDLTDADLVRALDLDPELALAYAIRGSILVGQGDMEGARAEYEQAAVLRPDYVVAHRNLGDINANLDDLEATLRAYSRAIEIDPEFPDTITWRGHTYIIMGEFEAALADYTRVIEITGDDVSAYADRAFGYGVAGDFESSLADYEKALEIDPENGDVLNGMAFAMAQHDFELQKAMDYINKALELTRDDPQSYSNALDTQAYIYHKMGQNDKALEIYNALLEVENPFTISYYGRGLTYEALGEKEKAISDLQAFLTDYPFYPQLSEDARAHLEALGGTAP